MTAASVKPPTVAAVAPGNTSTRRVRSPTSWRGAGHCPNLRDPVQINRAIEGFIRRLALPPPAPQVWVRGLQRRQRVLYLSSPIGLGHARRDVAIAAELRKLRPEVEFEWLAQHPVTTVLEAEGEIIHPASEHLVSESAHIASEAAGHDLHCFQALRRMDEIILANFMVIQEAVEEGLYDVVVGDESWDVDYYWHENPELKRAAMCGSPTSSVMCPWLRAATMRPT